MFDKIKGLFSVGSKKAKEQTRPPKAGHTQSRKAVRGRQSAKDNKKVRADSKRAGVAKINYDKADDSEIRRHIIELRQSLAYSRAQLYSGDATQVRAVRAARRQLALAQTKIHQNRVDVSAPDASA